MNIKYKCAMTVCDEVDKYEFLHSLFHLNTGQLYGGVQWHGVTNDSLIYYLNIKHFRFTYIISNISLHFCHLLSTFSIYLFVAVTLYLHIHKIHVQMQVLPQVPSSYKYVYDLKLKLHRDGTESTSNAN